jgi:acyl carrier protein
MTNSTLAATIRELVRSHISGCPEIDDHIELLDSGLLDSLAIVAVVAAIESACAIEFPPEMLVPETFQSAHALAGVVATLIRPGADPEEH